MHPRAPLVLTAVLALALVVPAAGSSPRSETASYFLGEGILTNGCFTDPENWAGTGGACFALDGSETSVDVAVEDDSGLPVFVATLFWDARGVNTAGVWRCGGTQGPVPIPPGTVVVEVDVDDPAWNTFMALSTTGGPSCLVGSVGTTGTITATFSDGAVEPAAVSHCRSGVGFIGRDDGGPGVDFGVLGCSLAGDRADTRWIAPGSDEVRLRHFMDQGVPTLVGHVTGLGVDADVVLTRVVGASGAVVYEGEWLAIDPEAEGEIVGTVALPDGTLATDTYRTFDAAG